MNRDDVVDELARAAADFRTLVLSASDADLARRSDGTRWSNRQLLFHMLFGYQVVFVLRPLVWFFAHSPRALSRGFARCLNAMTRPFHVVNYLGSLGGGRLLGRRGMVWVFDRITARLQASVRRADDRALARGMHFPAGWDPYFTDYMTFLDVYHYGTQHYDHHRAQLTLDTLPRPG
jgi:DinB superfamily